MQPRDTGAQAGGGMTKDEQVTFSTCIHYVDVSQVFSYCYCTVPYSKKLLVKKTVINFKKIVGA